MLEQRRVFREAVIIDGIHGFDKSGPMAGADEACLALEKAFLPEHNEREKLDDLAATMKGIEDVLKDALKKDAVVRKHRAYTRLLAFGNGIKYKLPLVLVAKPYDPKSTDSRLDICPLFRCDDPRNVKKQLDAIQASFDSLWQVYLFVHPIFHQHRFKPVHQDIEKRFLAYAKRHTDLTWNNAVKLEQLLPPKPIDIVSFIQAPEIEHERQEQQERIQQQEEAAKVKQNDEETKKQEEEARRKQENMDLCDRVAGGFSESSGPYFCRQTRAPLCKPHQTKLISLLETDRILGTLC